MEALRDFVEIDGAAIQRAFRRVEPPVNSLYGCWQFLADFLCPRQEILLRDGGLRVRDRQSLAILIQEIFVHQDYHFESPVPAPRILDCGSHVGFAVYYFKWLYPQARITAFEPLPENRDVLRENVTRNGWEDVEIRGCALSHDEQSAEFHVTHEYSMAASLTRRRMLAGQSTESITVPCEKLSRHLQEPVHFLKLDIEGVEDRVLREAADGLGQVQHLFCEYHDGPSLSRGRLAEILRLLEGRGFDVHVAKSRSWEATSSFRPMSHVQKPYSLGIWARSRDPKWQTETQEKVDAVHSSAAPPPAMQRAAKANFAAST